MSLRWGLSSSFKQQYHQPKSRTEAPNAAAADFTCSAIVATGSASGTCTQASKDQQDDHWQTSACKEEHDDDEDEPHANDRGFASSVPEEDAAQFSAAPSDVSTSMLSPPAPTTDCGSLLVGSAALYSTKRKSGDVMQMPPASDLWASLACTSPIALSRISNSSGSYSDVCGTGVDSNHEFTEGPSSKRQKHCDIELGDNTGTDSSIDLLQANDVSSAVEKAHEVALFQTLPHEQQQDLPDQGRLRDQSQAQLEIEQGSSSVSSRASRTRC